MYKQASCVLTLTAVGLVLVWRYVQGAPYAYTPFCDTNKETEPYRLVQGGWDSHHQQPALCKGIVQHCML